jgi:hypothetical protein
LQHTPLISPVRADHVGSLLRPAELLLARTSHFAPSKLEAVENRHVLRVFERQKEGNLLTEEEQWAKLQLVVDVAREVWD